MNENLRLMKREGGFADYISFMIILPIFFVLLVGGGYVAKSLQMMSTLNQALAIVNNNMTQNGALTTKGQTQLIAYLQKNHLDLSKVYLNATTTTQSFGSRGLEATLGYDFDLKAPGTSSVMWNKYYEVSTPMAQSQLIPGSGADSSGSVPLSAVFEGVQGGTDSGGSGSGSTPINVATSMTILASNSSPVINSPVIVSGKVYFGSDPAPEGTLVALNGGGLTQNVSTNSTGAFTASVKLSQPGTVQLQGKSGAAAASVSLSVKANVPQIITLQIPTTVRAGDLLNLTGTVLDIEGNTVINGTVVTISSSNTTDIPTTTVTTQAGSFSYTVNKITSLDLLSITASAGAASATKNVSVIPGDPKSVSLNLSSSNLVAGSMMTFSGRVLGPYGTPPAEGTPVDIMSGTDVADTLPAPTTDANGYFSGSAIITKAGNQAFYAKTTGPILSSTLTATVTAGAPYKVQGIVGSPSPVNMGANFSLSGYVSDQYNNPVVTGTSLKITSDALPSTISMGVLSGSFNARVTLQSPGVQTLSVKDGSGNPLSGGSLNINVMPTAAYTLTPTQDLYEITAGQTLDDVEFTLKDSNGQPVAGKTVEFNETPQGNLLIAPASAVTDSQGHIHTTVGPLTTAGNQTLIATMAGDSSIVGTVGINVRVGAPDQVFANISPSTTQVWTAANPVPLPLAVGTLSDSYGNLISGAEVIVSGGYGASASGITDTNGYFAVAIKPITIGGPFPITITSGTWSKTVGTLNVIPKPPTLTVTSLNGTAIADVNVPYSVLTTLTDSDGTPIKGVAVNLEIPTDGDADFLKSISTDSSGNALFLVEFSKVSNQSLTFSCTTNGKSLDSTLYLYSAIPIPGNVIYQSVTPTTVKAGDTLSVSGFVYSQFGNPMPPNTEVCLSLPGSNASAVITHTASDGSFTATLNPTKAGSHTLGCTVDSVTFNYGTNIKVIGGAPTTGTLTYSSATVQCGNYNTAYVHLFDNWGNNVPDATVTLGTNASVTVTQPPKTDENGIASVSVGPFNTIGTYHFYTTSPLTVSSVNFTVYDKKFVTISGPNYTSSGAVPSTYSYNSDGYTGTLSRSSIGSTVVSGSYTPEGAITRNQHYNVNCVRISSDDAEWAYLVNPGEMGIVFFRIPRGDEIPQTFYYHRDGFHGTLPHDTSSNSKDGYYTGSNYFYAPNGDKVNTYWFYLSYWGVVYNDAVDTRVYNYYGNYSGYVTKWP